MNEWIKHLDRKTENKGCLETLANKKCDYLQLSISSEQTCVSIGNNFRFMRHIAVTVNLL